MLCAVCGCNNYNNRNNKLRKDDISYFHFPKNPKLLEKWISFCGRNDVFNTTTARICSDHFTPDDIERNLQFELGLISKKRLRLKPGSIPSVYKNIEEDDSSGRSSRIVARENKKLVKKLLMDISDRTDSDEEESLEIIASAVNAKDPIDISGCENCISFKIQMEAFRLEIKTLEERCNQFTHSEIELRDKVKSLELELEQNKMERTNFRKKLSTIFTEGQIQMLSSTDNKQQRWSDIDIAKSLTLYSASAKAYKLLIKNEFPLPSVRTLQRWTHKTDDLSTPANISPVENLDLQAPLEGTVIKGIIWEPKEEDSMDCNQNEGELVEIKEENFHMVDQPSKGGSSKPLPTKLSLDSFFHSFNGEDLQ